MYPSSLGQSSSVRNEVFDNSIMCADDCIDAQSIAASTTMDLTFHCLSTPFCSKKNNERRTFPSALRYASWNRSTRGYKVVCEAPCSSIDLFAPRPPCRASHGIKQRWEISTSLVCSLVNNPRRVEVFVPCPGKGSLSRVVVCSKSE
jgi:hypothetical protein